MKILYLLLLFNLAGQGLRVVHIAAVVHCGLWQQQTIIMIIAKLLLVLLLLLQCRMISAPIVL